MFDTNFFKQFLERNNLPFPYYILLRTPQENEFHLIDSQDGSQPAGYPEIPDFEHDCVTEDNGNQHALLWLKYPDQVVVVAAFPQAIVLDNYTVELLYHLMLPVVIDRSTHKLETRFESMVANIAELSSVVDFDVLIDKILEKTLSIVKADAGMLWMYDSEIDRLVCKAYKGSATEQTLSLRLELGEGLIGKAFLRGTPKLYSRYEDALPDMENFSEENRVMMVTNFGDRRMNSAYVMPIFVNKQVECVSIVYRGEENNPFSAADIETLTIFAELIEMTMTNARSLITLQAHLDTLEKCNLSYSKLTSLSVNNSGIANIVRELKRILGIPVLVINLMTNEQYPRHAVFDRELFGMLTQLTVRNNDTFLIESEDGSGKHCVYPILVESSCMGYLVAGHEENEIQINKMILEIGRMVIALELSKTQSMLDTLFKKTSENFFELIDLNNPLDLAKKSSEMGLDSNADYAVVVLQLDLKENTEYQPSSIYRLIANIKKELAGTQRLVFSTQQKVTVLVSTQSATGLNLVRQRIHEVIAQAQKNENLSLCAGMGSLYSGTGNICKSYREAQNALMYQLSRHSQGLLQYSEMGVNQLFINLTPEEAATFLSKVFAPLRENSNRAEYLEATLIAYIESNFSVSQTAEKLFIHTNTLYQRLKTIENYLQISLKKPDDLLQVQLACYLRNIYPDIYNTL